MAEAGAEAEAGALAGALARAVGLVRGRPYHAALAALAFGIGCAPAAPGLLPPAAPGLLLAAAALALLALVTLRAPLPGILCAAAVVAGGALGHARLDAIDEPARRLPLGSPTAMRAHLLERPRPSAFGSRAEIRIALGRARGVRLVALATRGQGWPSGLEIGAELRVRGAVRRLSTPPGADVDFAAYLRRRGVHGELLLDSVAATGRRRGGMTGFVDALRRRAERGLAAGMPAREETLARGIVLGQDERVDEATRADWRAAGLAHLLAVSGQNVMLLVALAMPLLALAGLGPRGRGAALLALVALYVPLAGAGPSLQRAGVMGAAGIAAMTLSRPASRWYALLLAAALTLALNPRACGDPGWQLSFVAVTSILVAARPLAAKLRRIAEELAGPPSRAGPRAAEPVRAGPRTGEPVRAGPRAAEPVRAGPRTGPPVRAGPRPAGPVGGAGARAARARALGRAAIGGLCEGIAITVTATLATAPLLAYHFGSVPLAGLAANLLALPAVAPAMWLGMVKAALGVVSALVPAAGRLAEALGPLARVPIEYLDWLAERCATLPGGRLGLPLHSATAVVAAYAAMAAAVYGPCLVTGAARRGARNRAGARPRAGALELAAAWRRRPRSLRAGVCALVAALLFLAANAVLGAPRPPDTLTVRFLDIGQGDATLIQDGLGAAVLFDGGPPEARVYHDLRAAGVRRLDLMVATHQSRDHQGGLHEVLERIPTSLLLENSDGTRDRDFRRLLAEADARGIRRIPARAGQHLQVGRLEIEVLSPVPLPPGAPRRDDPNPRGVAAIVSAGDFDLWLSADAESDALLPLPLRPVDAMKVSHHGSADPGLPELLARLSPSVAAIEVGADNSYGHPTPQTLAALRARVPHVFRTDRHGTVTLTFAGGRTEVTTEHRDAHGGP